VKITDEKSVRRWMKKEFGDEIFWIEQRAGGNFGFPDCLIVLKGELLPVELKVDKLEGEFGPLNSKMWKPTLRAEQRLMGKKLVTNQVRSFVIVGDASTNDILMTTMEEVVIAMNKKGEAKVRLVKSKKDILDWASLEFLGSRAIELK
jgi:hypothetical protein